MAAGGAQLDAGGPGLMFIYLVHVMNGMAGGRIVAVGTPQEIRADENSITGRYL